MSNHLTKRQLALRISEELSKLFRDDEALKPAFESAGWDWKDFEGTANRRLAAAICEHANKPDSLNRFLEHALHGKPDAHTAEVRQLVEWFLANRETVWLGIPEKEFVERCPYRGMQPWVDSTSFFGRGSLIADLVRRVPLGPITLVAGGSGSGKSSLLVAGLIPKWKEQHGDGSIFRMTPRTDPFDQLYVGLSKLWEDERNEFNRAEEYRHPDESVLTRLAAAMDKAGQSCVMVVDQFEQLLIQSEGPQQKNRDQFLAAITGLARLNSPRLRLVIGMRDDFLGELNRYPDLKEYADRNLMGVSTLTGDSLREAIERPAAKHGVAIEPDLLEELVTDTSGKAGMLPLLQDYLVQLWTEEVRGGHLAGNRLLRKSTSDRLGGLLGALSRRLDRICEEVGDEPLRRIFLRVARFSSRDDSRVVSRIAALSELRPGDQAIVRRLIDQDKVLVPQEAVSGNSLPRFAVPHESILSGWPKLSTWLKGAWKSLVQSQKLEDDAQAWDADRQTQADAVASADEKHGWTKGKLKEFDQARPDLEQLDLPIGPVAEAFLAMSRLRIETEERRERDRLQIERFFTEENKRRHRFRVVLLVVATVGGISTVISWIFDL